VAQHHLNGARGHFQNTMSSGSSRPRCSSQSRATFPCSILRPRIDGAIKTPRIEILSLRRGNRAMNFAVAGLARIAQEIGDRLKEERKARLPNGRYDRPVSPQREADVSSNIAAVLPSAEASHSSSSRSVLGGRPLIPSKMVRSVATWAFSASSLSLMADTPILICRCV
jgi:hypothetical protein